MDAARARAQAAAGRIEASLATARGVSGGVVLDFGSDEITLLGINASQWNADDFLI